MSRGVSRRLSSSISSSSSSANDPNFCAYGIPLDLRGANRGEHSHLFVQEIQIGGAVVGNIPVETTLGFILVGPFNLAIPVFLIFLALFVVKREVGFFRGILAT